MLIQMLAMKMYLTLLLVFETISDSVFSYLPNLSLKQGQYILSSHSHFTQNSPSPPQRHTRVESFVVFLPAFCKQTFIILPPEFYSQLRQVPLSECIAQGPINSANIGKTYL